MKNTDDIKIIHPPSPAIHMHPFIYQPFNESKYSIHTIQDVEDDTLYELINDNTNEKIPSKSYIEGNLILKKQSIPTLAGTNIYNADHPAPTLGPSNFNVFGNLFGIAFTSNNMKMIRKISPFEYISCFQLCDNLTYILLNDKDYIPLLENGLPGLSSNEIITAIHFRLQQSRNDNTEIMIPDHSMAPAAKHRGREVCFGIVYKLLF